MSKAAKKATPSPLAGKPDPLADVLRAGQSIALLKHLHILTVDGKLNQDTRRKLKQVNHLLQFIEPLIASLRAEGTAPNLVDHGAGKSYLGFLLYDALFQSQVGAVWGIENRAELVQTSRSLAATLGFDRMGFVHGDTAQALANHELPQQVHIVTALHACNTATDDAIAFGLGKVAQYMVLVPCCQAEVASFLRLHSPPAGASALGELWRRPLHTREFGSQLTNVLRCLQLEAAGYQVTVTELVGWEHSMKNELILAKKTGTPSSKAALAARAKLIAVLDELHLGGLQARFLP
jgi:Methyltransferase domain